MKPLSVRALIATLSLLVFSTIATANTCDRLMDYEYGFVKSSIESDLVDGLWSANFASEPGTMFFYEDGLVEVVNHKSSELPYGLFYWDVQLSDKQPVLNISGLDGTIHKLRLYPTCDGFVVMDRCGSTSQLIKLQEEPTLQYNQTKRQLSGTWSIITPGDYDIGREIVWTFNDDGTFTLAVAPDLYHASHRGVWDVTPSGEHIILYFAHQKSPETVYAAELLKVKSVDFEDLLLDGSTMPRMLDEFEANRTLHFEKNFNL